MDSEQLTTCLWFDGQAEEAAAFYTSLFTNSRLGQATPGPTGETLTIEFELNGQPFVALNGGPEHTFTPAISFQVPCADQEELDYYWNGLIAGGAEVACGWVTDRYGVSWQIVPTELPELLSDPDPEKAKRAADAMLSMTKLDIAALRKAYAGA